VGLGQEPREATMATISKDSNNNLRGKLGNLVYYESKGQSCVRSMPSKYTDKKSDKQIINRERIKGMGSLFQIFRPAIRYVSMGWLLGDNLQGYIVIMFSALSMRKDYNKFM
jgi:hypothetical protein